MISSSVRSKSPLGTIGQMKDFLSEEWSNDYAEMTCKLEEICNIEIGDKIGKTNNKYYIHKSGLGSWVTRKLWYGENRENTIEYLKKDFKIFFRFLDKVIYNTKTDILNIYNRYNKKIINFVKHAIPGLYNLKMTYKNEQETWISSDKIKIIATIDSIILTLFDFNKKMIDLQHENKSNHKNYGKLMLPKFRTYSDYTENYQQFTVDTLSI